jgi:hypothetical protein
LVIYGHPAAYTTARYFQRAACRDESLEVDYLTEPKDIPALGRDDFFLFVDPAEDWPLGLETWPCLRAVDRCPAAVSNELLP